MRKSVLLALLIASQSFAAAPALEQKVDAAVAPFVHFNTFSGVVLIARGDDVLLNKAYGMANAEFGVPNTPETRFPIASISKRFTMVIVRRLAAEKKLSLDDPISKWVPAFPSAEKITVEHLLTHRSGIEDPESLRRMIRMNLTPAQVVERLAKQPLASAPGEKYSYTTANYAVLAQIIEKVTGETFARVAKRMIYDPSKMANSGDLTTTSVVPRLASGYMPDPYGNGLAVCGPEDTSWKAAGGSGYATALDLHKFHRALYAGRLLPEGLSVGDVFKPATFLERAALRSSGSFPGANANAMYFLEEGVSIVVLSNNYASVSGALAERITRIHFGAEVEASPAPKVVEGIKPHASMAGDWRIEDMPWPFSISLRDGTPLMIWNEIRQGSLLPIDKDTWFTPFDWATLKFERDQGGMITGGTMTAAWLEKPAKLVKVVPAPVAASAVSSSSGS